MEIVLAMYGCMMYALGYGKWIGTGLGLGMMWRNWGLYMGIVIVVCLIYNLLPQQNKK